MIPMTKMLIFLNKTLAKLARFIIIIIPVRRIKKLFFNVSESVDNTKLTMMIIRVIILR